MLIYFGIGSNIGDRDANLRRAVGMLHERVGDCLACSSIYRSAPDGFVSENEFANIVAVCETAYSPEEVLLLTQQIEREMGRTEKTVNGVYHDRVIDIDLLKAIYNSQTLTLNSASLTLPHPRMEDRAIVMIPLREVEQIL